MYYSIQLYFMQEKYIHFTTVEPGYSEIIAIVKVVSAPDPRASSLRGYAKLEGRVPRL